MTKAGKNLLVAVMMVFSAASLNAQTLYEGYSSWFGALAAGGSPVSAGANTLGPIGHFSVGVDGTFVRPEIENNDFSAGSYSAIVRLGVLEGRTLGPGLHGIGSVDFYLKAGQMFLNAERPTDVGHIGGGVRIGILRNSITSPALSVSVGYHSTSGLKVFTNPVDILAPEVEMSLWAFRADISKNLFFVTPYAGVGFNSSDLEVTDSGATWRGDDTESVFYGGLEWNILLLHLGLEIGRSGEETYGTVGARIAL